MDNLSFESDNTAERLEPKLSKVVGIFLAQFDIKSGYKLVWSKSTQDNLNFNSLDYKVLPSGIHDTASSTILISHRQNGKLYHGIARFQQRVLGGNNEANELNEANEQLNRDNIKMYSLGIICEPHQMSWKPNEYIQNGWEYIDILDSNLTKFLNDARFDDISIFEDMFDKLTSSLFPSSPAAIENHLLNKMYDLFDILGPLVFVIYKECILRKKIVFFNNTASNVDCYTVGAFTYLLSLLSMVPKDVEKVVKCEDFKVSSEPVYNIGLKDMNSELLQSSNWIGSTSDDILMYHKDLFDVAVFLPSNVIENTIILNSFDIGTISLDFNKRIKSTLKDYQKFKIIYRSLGSVCDSRRRNSSADDIASIKTSNSLLSFFKTQDQISDLEPAWWLKSATSPISWREYIWSAFSWFASAGQVSDNNKIQNEESQPSLSGNSSNRFKLHQIIGIVGSFHKLTRKWFYLINEIITEKLDEQSSDSNTHEDFSDTESLLLRSLESNKISIELTYQDIIDMELDPYSEQDLQFAKDFVKLYWDSVVDSVNIGLGIESICC
ncbi:uncharacterized protein PRCAT00001223001 [Priceomyces carsonii]|uniref:uncharacterized protein n=1 Tax=Priceomyces carsonii TaxID=28549 RepID=UPI002ED8AD53|nr:unnamed protein product [Priceomyces carsonii]